MKRKIMSILLVIVLIVFIALKNRFQFYERLQDIEESKIITYSKSDIRHYIEITMEEPKLRYNKTVNLPTLE